MNPEIEGVQLTKAPRSLSKLSSTTKASVEGVERGLDVQSMQTVELDRVHSEVSDALRMMEEIRSQLKSQQQKLEEFN